jgi:glycine cleavage system T protein (aminomethyltransferase)
MAFERARLKNDFGDPAGEARACRKASAVFDFSFLECVRLSGPGAREVVETYVGRPLNKLAQGSIAYAVRTDASAMAVADLTVWRTATNAYEIMSGRSEDVTALMACASTEVEVTNVGADRSVFAAQGPNTLDVLRQLGDVDRLANLTYFHFARTELAGAVCTVGRLGYTGEAGFEIIVQRADAPRLWAELSRHARPAGFVAADMLRIEAGFVLFDNEFRVPVSPEEAGLAQFTAQRNAHKIPLKLISFRCEADRLSEPWVASSALDRPDRPGVIAVTSACRSVAAGSVLGLGFVAASTVDSATLEDPSRQFRDIRRTRLPFYDTSKRRPRLPWR